MNSFFKIIPSASIGINVPYTMCYPMGNYWHFECTLYEDKGLINNSVEFKVEESPHNLSPTEHFFTIASMASIIISGVNCYLHCIYSHAS